MSRFYSNEQVSIEKNVENIQNVKHTSPDDIENVYEITRTAAWIKTNNFKKVCLQFPDYLLPDSTPIALELQKQLEQTVYIMADTVYESCCPDFVSAAHIEADAIVHYGTICFSKPSNTLPILNIYEKMEISVEIFKEQFKHFTKDKEEQFFVLVDTPYIHKYLEIKEALDATIVIKLDEPIDFSKHGVYIYIGNNLRKMDNIQYSLKEKTLFQYDPVASKIVNFEQNPMILKRRYFLAEKIKDSYTFGIVIGTLSVENYMTILLRIKNLLIANNKKYYIISVGKISVAKLANFPEIDVFIVITCAMNEIYDSKEFHKPIVTPYDVEKALNLNSDTIKFTYDYNRLLEDLVDDIKPSTEPDISLITGNLRITESKPEESTSHDIALRPDGTLIESKFGAGFLSNRSWKGLEQNLGKTDVVLATEGRKGIAQSYSNETDE